VEDAERVLRVEVVQSFYRLLASQQIIAELRELLAEQQNLLQAGEKRFAREDISILELNTLRLDRDEVRNELANKMLARVSLEKQLRVLMALQDDGSLQVTGDLPDLLTRQETVPAREALQACILANRADVKAAKLAVEVREAELRLAQARRIPDVALGPRYKRDNNQNFIGGEIAIPLPFFNRNQEEIATAVANRDTSRVEMERRILAAKQEVDSTYKEIDVSKENLASYETDYIHDIGNILILTRRAYESGEMTIFEFSNLRNRLAETRLQYLDATIGYLGEVAKLEAQAPWCFAEARANQSVPW
jgi:cobalt-zinc-cadmium efflux system outer membrane protein